MSTDLVGELPDAEALQAGASAIADIAKAAAENLDQAAAHWKGVFYQLDGQEPFDDALVDVVGTAHEFTSISDRVTKAMQGYADEVNRLRPEAIELDAESAALARAKETTNALACTDPGAWAPPVANQFVKDAALGARIAVWRAKLVTAQRLCEQALNYAPRGWGETFVDQVLSSSVDVLKVLIANWRQTVVAQARLLGGGVARLAVANGPEIGFSKSGSRSFLDNLLPDWAKSVRPKDVRTPLGAGTKFRPRWTRVGGGALSFLTFAVDANEERQEKYDKLSREHPELSEAEKNDHALKSGVVRAGSKALAAAVAGAALGSVLPGPGTVVGLVAGVVVGVAMETVPAPNGKTLNDALADEAEGALKL